MFLFNDVLHLAAICTIFFLLPQCTSKTSIEKPPAIQPEPVTENYFGIEVTDPYRNLENLEDTMVINWMTAQANYARNIINSIPARQRLIDKMVEFDSRASSKAFNLKITDNDRYFYLKTTPEDETEILFYRDGFEGPEFFLFDPAKYDETSSKKFAIKGITPSYAGDKVIIEVAPDGSENADLLIMDVHNKALLSEKIEQTVFAYPFWVPDGSGFLYNSATSGDVSDKDRKLNSKVFFHEIGTDFKNDVEIFSSTKNPELNILPEEIPVVGYDKDCGYLIGVILTVDSRLIAYSAPLGELFKDKINWKPMLNKTDEVYDYFATDKELFVYTPKGAPNFKIMKTSITSPDLENAEIVVPEDKNRVLTGFVIAKDALYYTLSQNGVQEKVFRMSLDNGNVEELELPFVSGTAYIASKGCRFDDFWVVLTGWANDSKRYRYINETKEFRAENLSDEAEYPEYKNLVVEEIMVPSRDGVEIPLSLIYDNELRKDGSNPVFIRAYGAYGISLNPRFSPNWLLFTNNGGIIAVAHVRGGGELGDSWHKGGYKSTKPNTWKDLIACSEYLISENYTSSKKIAIWSASAGGILIGRAITERPDLFSAAISEVGCMNTVRAENTPNGPVNTPEFGTVRDSVECMALIEMDSYLHLKNGEKYPATLITAGINDPRVIAWEPAKFAARMQEVNGSDKPVLFLTDFAAGHGIGDTKTKQFEGFADIISFALWQTGHPDFQTK